MDPLTSSIVLTPETTVIDAVSKISRGTLGRAAVIKDGRVVGMLSRGDVMRLLELKSTLK
jgi:CBS domain-containing protein